MSQPLATKVSTPITEIVQMCPKCEYFVWQPLFSSTASTLWGMEFTRASQVATGILFHSSMMTSRATPCAPGELVNNLKCSYLLGSLDPLQFAFRPNRSTDDAIFHVLHTTLNLLDTGKGR
ncbi:hypothetical protein AMECASPLE_020083 [Ameca splendens]|uniref:Uncharacterized protein n=1 Tax=Ameca splendens TaxID=208324 RepID=A0ABV0YQG8_9TELE